MHVDVFLYALGLYIYLQLITIIPVCGEDEFLTSNGTHLICRTLRKYKLVSLDVCALNDIIINNY